METVDIMTGHTVARWEEAAAGMSDVKFISMRFHKGIVCGVLGTVRSGSQKISVRWLRDGRCFASGKRMNQYDIKL